MDKLMQLMGRAMALNLDFEIWYMALEEHYKRGIEGVVKDMIVDMKPRYIPKWLWKKWIKQ